MDGMFDHNHDGKLSPAERMERDYFVTEMMNHSDHTPQVQRSSGLGKAGAKLLGVLFLMIGLISAVYFPVFAVIMIILAILLFVN